MLSRRIPLGTLLGGFNAGLLLVALGGLAWVAISLLWRLADEQALGRVLQANTSAQIVIARIEHDTLLDARLLSERPTLRRLITDENLPELRTFLDRFRTSSLLDGVAVQAHGQLLVAQGLALPPILPSAEQPLHLLASPDGDGLLLTAYAALPDLPTEGVIVIRRLGQRVAEDLSGEIGLAAFVFSLATSVTDAQRAELHNAVLTDGTPRAQRLAILDRYVAVSPIRDALGFPIGIIEVQLPADSVNGPVRAFIQLILLLAVALAIMAALLNLLAGRILSRPLARLTTAALFIGRGDLERPIPRGLSAEIDTLSTTLDEMRLRLLSLTADLRRQQSEREAILTGIVEGVYSVDRERRVRYINPQAATLLGVTPDAAIGRFCGDLLNPRRLDGVRPCEEHCPIIHARFRQGARATEQIVGHDGRIRHVVITAAPLVDEVQVQVLRDETEIETSRRLRDTIMANISHEFRTPLSAQLASIELLLDQLPDLSPDQIGQLVRSLQRSTLRLTQLVDNLLESARVEAGHIKIRQRQVALDAVVEDALELIRPLLEQRSQTTVNALPYPLPMIIGDAARLTQVFVNLLANAHKYAPTGSTITVGGAVEAESIRLWVADQGTGSALLRDGTPFERFVRTAGDEPEQSGMGLGLWICQSIIERHRGTIEARSSSEGTTVSITLPKEVP